MELDLYKRSTSNRGITVFTLKYLINEYTRLDNAVLIPTYLHFFPHTRLFSLKIVFHTFLLDPIFQRIFVQKIKMYTSVLKNFLISLYS